MNTRNLPVKLTREERELRSSQLQETLDARDLKDSERKAAAEGYKRELEAFDTRATILRIALRTGVEYREVEVEERPRPAAGMVDIYRVDTGELVDTREMTETERQVVLVPPLAAVDAEPEPEAAPSKRRRRAAAPGMI